MESLRKIKYQRAGKGTIENLLKKDTDARWTLRNNKSSYGYKNHIIVDAKTKIMRDFEVTSASVHYSQVYEELVAEVKPDEVVFADSAYSGEELKILTKNKNAEPLFCMKGKRNKPLTKVEQEWNMLYNIRKTDKDIKADIQQQSAKLDDLDSYDGQINTILPRRIGLAFPHHGALLLF